MAEKKLIMNLSDEMYEQLEKVKKELMLRRTPIVRLAIKRYCDKVLQDEK